ncbi:MAG: hypothetical protein EOP36_17800, partial [Rubrivivax sp.]
MNTLAKPFGLCVMAAGLLMAPAHAHAEGFLKISSQLSRLPTASASVNRPPAPRPVTTLKPIGPAGGG